MKGWQNICLSCRDGFREQVCCWYQDPTALGGVEVDGITAGTKEALGTSAGKGQANPQASSKQLHSSNSTSGQSPQPEKWFNHSCSQLWLEDQQRGTINSLSSGISPYPALYRESLTQGMHSSAPGTSKSNSQLSKVSEALCYIFNKRLQLTSLHFFIFFYTQHPRAGSQPHLGTQAGSGD